MTEGIIKFSCSWEEVEIFLPEATYVQLETSRQALYARGLVGVYPDGIGYGNLSVRSREGKSYYISGSGTGSKACLEPGDYAQVTDYHIQENHLTCRGLVKASSESLTHAAIYEVLPTAQAVLHVHCLWMWEKLLYNYPATSNHIRYGTPEMAQAVGRLALEIHESREKILVMAGHQEGILAFGEDLTQVTDQIINIYNRYKQD